MPEAFVLEALRTPRAKASPRGGLHAWPPVELVSALLGALVERTGMDPAVVDDVILGCASQVDEQGANVARMATLLAGWGERIPGVTLNRFCASGIDSVVSAAASIRSGFIQVAIAGGVESVSRVPMFSDRGPLWEDPGIVERIGSVHMGVAADLIATLEGYDREQLDAYGLETQQKAARAWAEGFYERSVVPLPASPGVGGRTDVVLVDEHLRPGETAETLASLPPAFESLGASGQDRLAERRYPMARPIRHLHTVGTSPGLADAAAVVLLGDVASAESMGLAPRARVVGAATAAVDPVIMLTAGQEAAERALERCGLAPQDIDVFEFAEAFAASCLRFRRALDAGPDRMNPNGGTIAMGHAFGATGTILVANCVDELERRDGRFGLVAVSGAAGLGVAVLLERV